MKEKILEILNNNSEWMEHHSTDDLYIIESKEFDKIADELVKLLIIGDVVGSNKLWLIEEDLVLCDNCGWVGDQKMLLPKTDLIIERDNKCPDCGSGEIEYFE